MQKLMNFSFSKTSGKNSIKKNQLFGAEEEQIMEAISSHYQINMKSMRQLESSEGKVHSS